VVRNEAVIRDFIAAINDHDVARIVGLSTDDHQFVDAHGVVVPRETLEAAWTGYFAFMPRYGIEIDAILCEGDTSAVFGFAWGGLDGSDPASRTWRRPCAWRAVVAGDRIRLWQVYVDTKAVFDLL
jgi:ketosteroid isomerase-like protein